MPRFTVPIVFEPAGIAGKVLIEPISQVPLWLAAHVPSVAATTEIEPVPAFAPKLAGNRAINEVSL